MAFNSKMHERNMYRTRIDFAQIAMDFPSFRKFAIPKPNGKVYVDFSDTEALRTLSTILLKRDFDLVVKIPRGFLVPTIPQRLNYILWVEDLLSQLHEAKENIYGVDIGTGPCAIFSVLGSRKNGWNFTATESSDDALYWANMNIERNNLNSKINVVKVSPGSILEEVLSTNEVCYQFCLCNPPFYENPGDIRKKYQNTSETLADIAHMEEIFVKGGELEFVRNLLEDSLIFQKRIRIFTSMFGKKSSFVKIHKELKEIQNVKVSTTEFCQGNTVRWGIAWTFDNSVQFEKGKKKKDKPKRPLEYQIPIINPRTFKIDRLIEKALNILTELEICYTMLKSTNHYAELLLKSDKSTWTHQRRKRRELERQQKRASKDSKEISSGEKLVHTADDVSSKLGNGSEEIMCSENINSEAAITTTRESEDAEHNDPVHTSGINASGVVIKLEDDASKQLINADPVPETKEKMCPDDASKQLINADSIPETKEKLCPDSSVEIGTSHNIRGDNSTTYTQIPSCSSDSFTDDNVSPNKKRKLDLDDGDSVQMKKVKLEHDEDSVQMKKVKLEHDGHSVQMKKVKLDERTVRGTVLNCKLELIKGKYCVFVKMYCSPGADRNVMYQVFQVVKNKLK